MIDRQRKKLQEALEQRAGFYTTEEEADNLALDWLSLARAPVEDALTHWLLFARANQGSEQESAYNLSYERCLQLYEARPRWNEDGREAPVPVGSYVEDHHSTCFRLYNIERLLAYRSTLHSLPDE